MTKSLSEIKTDYNPEERKYSFNQVNATSNGLVVEMDDTPENVRYHVFHPSGSFYEMQHLGNVVNKVVADNHLIVKGSQQTQIKGSEDKFVGGKQSLLVKNNSLEVIEKDSEKIILGNLTQKIGKKFTQVVGGAFLNSIAGVFSTYCFSYMARIGSKFQTKGDKTAIEDGSFAVFASKDITMNAGVQLTASGYPYIDTSGDFTSGYYGELNLASKNAIIKPSRVELKSDTKMSMLAEESIYSVTNIHKMRAIEGFELSGNVKISGKLFVTGKITTS